MTKEYEYKLLALDSRDYITNKIIFSMLDDENLERRFSKFQEEIFSLKSNLVDDLSDKNIRYNDFRNAITPYSKNKGRVYLFNTSEIASQWYGNYVFGLFADIILQKQRKHAILAGDLLINCSGEELKGVLRRELDNDDGNFNWNLPQEIFAIYVTNVTNGDHEKIIEILKREVSFVGSKEFNSSSLTREILGAAPLITIGWIIDRSVVVINPESDTISNPRYALFDTVERGKDNRVEQILGLPDKYAMLLLPSIRSHLTQTKDSILFSMLALTGKPLNIDNIEIELSDDKIAYMVEGKHSKSAITSYLKEVGVTEFKEMILDEIRRGYYFDLTYATFDDGEPAWTFAIQVDLHSTATGQVVLKVDVESDKLTLITAY